MILPAVRDPRLITIRRGGSLTDADHQALALWAADCAEHVLPYFVAEVPDDPRPAASIGAARSWARGDLAMMAARAVGGHAMGAARPLAGAARFAAYAAGQAACVGHVAEHDLGAAAYAIKAARESWRIRRRVRRTRLAAEPHTGPPPRSRARGPGASQRDLLVGFQRLTTAQPPDRCRTFGSPGDPKVRHHNRFSRSSWPSTTRPLRSGAGSGPTPRARRE